MMIESKDGLAYFLTEDTRGKNIPAYMVSLASSLKEEHEMMCKETELLQNRIDHIKEIVAMQQNYGRVYGISETISPKQLMEDALVLQAGSLVRHEITVLREYETVPLITMDKHKVLQVLLNLINNAKYACTDGGGKEKTIILRLLNHGSDRILMQVVDNGIGITPENITRIFQHGFTASFLGC